MPVLLVGLLCTPPSGLSPPGAAIVCPGASFAFVGFVPVVSEAALLGALGFCGDVVFATRRGVVVEKKKRGDGRRRVRWMWRVRWSIVVDVSGGGRVVFVVA